MVKKNIKIIYNFCYLFYSLKFKHQFRKWLWERVRLPKIEKFYHPDNLIGYLKDEETNLDEVLIEWVKN